tara:strand:- start:354 stop:767 length:414 start_codon:yes stop_codon:yes gene_type:complete
MKSFKIIKIDHIAIATKESKQMNNFFSKIFIDTDFKKEIVESENVVTAFFNVGDVNIETLEPTSEDSIINKYLNKNGPGIHHVAFLVDNINAAISYFKNNNIRVIYDPPKIGASNKLITFLHPKDTFGILMELSQNQ